MFRFLFVSTDKSRLELNSQPWQPHELGSSSDLDGLLTNIKWMQFVPLPGVLLTTGYRAARCRSPCVPSIYNKLGMTLVVFSPFPCRRGECISATYLGSVHSSFFFSLFSATLTWLSPWCPSASQCPSSFLPPTPFLSKASFLILSFCFL